MPRHVFIDVGATRTYIYLYDVIVSMSTCLYIGRFQPIHIGHLDVIHQIFDHGVQKIVMGIGSSNITNERNPRSLPQRQHMIEQSFVDRGMDQERIDIVGIPDFSDDEDRLSYITSTIKFDSVMSGNSRVVDIFRSNDFLVLDELERIAIHGTDIRVMIDTEQWGEVKKWVTPSVYELLQG